MCKAPVRSSPPTNQHSMIVFFFKFCTMSSCHNMCYYSISCYLLLIYSLITAQCSGVGRGSWLKLLLSRDLICGVRAIERGSAECSTLRVAKFMILLTVLIIA